jgi:hypothetical protein
MIPPIRREGKPLGVGVGAVLFATAGIALVAAGAAR